MLAKCWNKIGNKSITKMSLKKQKQKQRPLIIKAEEDTEQVNK